MNLFKLFPRLPAHEAVVRKHLEAKLNGRPPPRLQDRANSVAARGVTPWQIVLSGQGKGAQSVLMSHANRDGLYSGMPAKLPELETLLQWERLPGVNLDIQDVHGLLHSKSVLTEFDSLEEMATKNSPELLGDKTPQQLQKLLGYGEFPILGLPHRKEEFEMNLWDSRIYLLNDSGSHHFAAAKAIAAHVGQAVPLKAPITLYRLDAESLAKLSSKFAMFFIAGRLDLEELLQKHQVHYMAKATTWHFSTETDKVLFLPTDVPASQSVARVLRDMNFQDVGEHLSKQLAAQLTSMVQPYIRSELFRELEAEERDGNASSAPVG